MGVFDFSLIIGVGVFVFSLGAGVGVLDFCLGAGEGLLTCWVGDGEGLLTCVGDRSSSNRVSSDSNKVLSIFPSSSPSSSQLKQTNDQSNSHD